MLWALDSLFIVAEQKEARHTQKDFLDNIIAPAIQFTPELLSAFASVDRRYFAPHKERK